MGSVKVTLVSGRHLFRARQTSWKRKTPTRQGIRLSFSNAKIERKIV